MANYDVEAAYVGQFWRATTTEDADGPDTAWRGVREVEPEMIEDPGIRSMYDLLRIRFVEGEPNDTADVTTDVMSGANEPARAALSDVVGQAITHLQLPHYSGLIDRDYRRRTLLDLTRKATRSLENGVAWEDGGRRMAERLSLRIMETYSRGGPGGIQTKEELIEAGKERALAPAPDGVAIPWPKLEKHCGPWIPGEVVGVTSYPNQGKSIFAANLFFQLARRGVPVIAFPTEMREQWLDRGVAALAGVEQWRAEKRQWHGAEAKRDGFVSQWEQTREWDWAAVNRPSVTPSEIAAATRIIRRKWPGRTVVTIVDHMHRLDYGPEEPDDMAGPATRQLKNLAGSDSEGGLIMVLLYQPKKPERGNVYSPAAGHRIRGHSSVWSELDVHLPLFRSWVRESYDDYTEWGTPAAAISANGTPMVTPPEADGAKLDDEHVYVKVDKRRVGGEGPVVILDIHAPSGQIFEQASRSDEMEEARYI